MSPPTPDADSSRPGNPAAAPAQSSGQPTSATGPLAALPKDELEHVAAELGLEPGSFRHVQGLLAAIHGRKQLIATFDRDAMLDVIRWGRRPVQANLNKEQLAQEIVRIKSMRFDGLSQPGLAVLAWLRNVQIAGNESPPTLIHKLKRQEGFFTRLNRKRRSFLGKIVANMIGESGGGEDYQFVPPDGQTSAGESKTTAPPGASGALGAAALSLKDEIEEAGLIGGIAGRIKKSADSYLNQKLDEIESRIDRKLDEIDRRLAEWRDKEISNRIKILKITLWASVIVGAFSLIYAYVTKYFLKH